MVSSENKKTRILASFALIAILTFATFMATTPTANAHDPPWQIPLHGYVTAAINPGNPPYAVIVFWVNIPPPTANSPTAGYRWSNMRVDITKPDGTNFTQSDIYSDPIGGGYLIYTPTDPGTYTVTFTCPTQTLTAVNPVNGQVGNTGSPYINDTYIGTTATTTFIYNASQVVPSFQEAPLPVSYWTRPIDSNNQLWSSIASDWLGQQEFGATYLKFNPYGRAPNTAHVMWTYPLSFGGQVGGDNAIVPDMGYYSGTQYQLKFSNPLIMYGTVIFSLPAGTKISGTGNTGGGITCVDLRTGETKWTNPDIASVTFGQVYDNEEPNEHGAIPILWDAGSFFGETIYDTSIRNPNQQAVDALSGPFTSAANLGQYPSSTQTLAGGQTSGWVALDPNTGKVMFNETGIPSGTRAYGPHGEWLIYTLGGGDTSHPFTYLTQWNNTQFPGDFVGGTNTDPWTQTGSFVTYNMTAGYDWNVTLSQPLYPTQTSIGAFGGGLFSTANGYNATTGMYLNNPTILRVFPGNLILGQSSGLQQTPGTSAGVFGTPDNFELWAINLDPHRGAIGTIMWDRTYSAPADNITVNIGPADGDTMVFTLYYKETLQWLGFDLNTGDKLWETQPTTPAWNYYTGTTSLTNPIGMGYGHLYIDGYGGILYAFDLKTGHLDFTYGNDPNDPNNSTYTSETTYGDYPTQVAAIADGKVYLVEEEHSMNAPPYHGAMTRCVNATTGELLWEMYGMSSWQEQAVADGYYVWLNLNDMQVYCIGPGPSATTVTTNPGVVTQGNGVMITGTVTDQSPLLKDTPAISDCDQGNWMNYMVEHNVVQPNAVGVPVQLTAVNSNGVATDLGTVTSDMYGTFHKLWTPDATGEYTIVANFLGTQSYGPSSAATAIGVTTAPSGAPVTPTPTPTTTTSPTTSTSPTASVSPPNEPSTGFNTALYVAIAAIVIIAIIVAVAVLLRRRK